VENYKGLESWHGLEFALDIYSSSEGFVVEKKVLNENFNNWK
jgi:hypothetical protein